MVERWHRETHTFHLPIGEITITLQDVAMIWGLNIDGIPITGVDTAYTKNELQQRCLYWLGFMPEDDKIKGGHLSLGVIRKHCLDHMIQDDSTDDDVAKYSRCVALLIISGCMFSDSESSAVKLMYLPFLQDIDSVNTYSWGSREFSWVHTVRHSVRTMRHMLDRMVDGQFKWKVYEMESPELNMYLERNKNLLCWSACLLINFDIVEMHRPERCLRQFGMRQGILPPATNYDNFHKLTRQERPDFDWDAFQKQFVDMWTDRYNFVICGEFIISGTPDTTLEYTGWYRRISHIFVSPMLEQEYQQQGHASMSQPPTWPQNEGEVGTSMTNNPRYKQNFEDPRPSTTNSTFYTPSVMSSFEGYDRDFHTPYVGSFTQLL
ncbi:serine/threonine-protein phosphatase 7 long form homolog [Henckelia pumila]|uniref:serine/threonine-protein phosphatase 7 long form homolog n=1 Tax=Henckelia pumila TaxID=405737 RepID=UPI003C6E5E99